MLVISTLFFVIVKRGEANKILKKAQECGASGGTIFLGEEIVQSNLLDLFGQNVIDKEVLMISSSDELCEHLHETLSKESMFGKRNKGKVFSIPFKRWQLETTEQEQEQKNPPKPDKKDVSFSHFCIVTIVDKGRGKACIKAAKAAGVKSGTLIYGRGAGIPEDFYFPLVIEPQKDIVIIISTKYKVTQIKKRIFYDMELEKAGNGIIFSLPVIWTSGFLKKIPKKRKRDIP